MSFDPYHISLDNDLQPYIGGILADRIGSVKPQISLQRINPNVLKVHMTFSLTESIQQDDWQLCIQPAFTPTFHWAPHLTPTDQHIIDQHSFRSPAIVAHDQQKLLILMPDLDIMQKGTAVRWYMDNDVPKNQLTLGMSEYHVKQHVLYERNPGAEYPAGPVEVGFYLMTYDDPEILNNPWRPVLHWQWEKWGSPLFNAGEPLEAPLSSYVQHTYQWAFESWESSVWQEFELHGHTVGAAAFIVDATQSPNYPGPASEREFRSIWNQAWFSSLRSAQGIYRYAQETQNDGLFKKARLAKELALSAPQRNGMFPSVIATEMEMIEVEGKEMNRSKGWETAFWGNSNRNPVAPWESVKGAPYHILDMSWTALWMLRWYEELEKDQRLLDYVLTYADALLEQQDQQGYFPAWLDFDSLQPLKTLKDSPETACSVTFLLKLFQCTGDQKYADAAFLAADAVAENIVPIGRWEDFETYWSCSSFGSEDHVGEKYVRNNMYKQNNFSIYWTAEAFLRCYELTGEKKYIKLGERCLDELLMTQASWQPPYLYVPVLGGFGVMNGDGEWDDARQSLFAELIIEYGKLLHRNEYIERGIAALRCSFVMMYCPENPKAKEQWEKAHPYFNDRDYGFTMENYGHSGKVNAKGQGMGRFTIFDWGNGAAAESYLRMKEHHNELISKYGL